MAAGFRREADTAARLAHPDIVAVYARGEQDGQLWSAMEYVDGTDVGEVLRAGRAEPLRCIGSRIRTRCVRAAGPARRPVARLPAGRQVTSRRSPAELLDPLVQYPGLGDTTECGGTDTPTQTGEAFLQLCDAFVLVELQNG